MKNEQPSKMQHFFEIGFLSQTNSAVVKDNNVKDTYKVG